jgi:hypothetical protein
MKIELKSNSKSPPTAIGWISWIENDFILFNMRTILQIGHYQKCVQKWSKLFDIGDYEEVILDLFAAKSF